MNQLRLVLASTLVVGMLAAVIGVLGFSGPPPLSAQTGTGEQLTAQFSNVPTSHDGTELTFGLTFTLEPELSYVTLREHAFSVTGGTITRAKRVVRDSNVQWTIMVVPDLDTDENPAGAITIVLPPTSDCTVQSAICTSGDLPLSNKTEATIPVSTSGPDRPGQPQSVTATQGPDIGEITLGWTAAAVDDSPEAAVRGYRVRRYCGGETTVARLDPDSRSFVIEGIDRSTTCLLNVAARNDGGFGPVAWAGSDSTRHPPMNPPEAPASITVTPDEDSDGTKVSWTAPAEGEAPTSYQVAYWDIGVEQFQYVDHSSTTDLEAVIDAPPADLRTVAVRGRIDGVGYGDRGVWGSWAVGWHESATPSRLDAMTQSSSLNLSPTYPGGRRISFSKDADLKCLSVGGVYVDTATDTAWITDPCSKWVNAFDIGSDGTLTHDVDTSLTMSELYPPGGVGRRDPMYGPQTLWSDGEILWVAERDIGMMLPYRLSDGKFLPGQRFIMAPYRPEVGHSFLAPAAVWSDGKTLWVADAMIDQLIFAVNLENERWVRPSQDIFVPSAFDNCYIPERPRPSDMMPSATCTDQTTLRAALDNSKRDSPVGAYSDGRWFWIAVDYSDNNKAGRLLAFNLLSGERAASRDIALHHDIKNPIGMWSDGENLWAVDSATRRLHTFTIPDQTSQQQAANSPPTGLPTISGTPQVDETLTADKSGIADADGLDNATFSYQWLADDVDISGATGASYRLTDSEEGKVIKVRVSFTDDAGNQESLTSVETAAVAIAPSLLTASVHDAPESHDGENAFTFELRLSEEPVSSFSYVTLGDHAFTVTGGEVGNVQRLNAPSNVRWEITVTPDGDGEVSVVLPVTQDCAAQGAICTGDGRMLSAEVNFVVAGPGDEEEGTTQQNSPPTGAPTISGTAQVGQTLTADVSSIADADGLDNVSYTYQWLADNVNISGATGASYRLTDSEEGKAVKVTVSFTDDAGNEESLTSAVTSTVAAKPFGLDDLDAGDGQTVLASALIQAGNRGRKNNGSQDRAWYALDTSAWHASGELPDGSLAWNGMTLNRVAYFSATGALRFNEADDAHIGNSFAAGGVNREVTVWIQTDARAVSFLAKDNIMNSGSGWINFEVPAGIRSLLAGVSKDDLVIVAVSAPADP